MTAYDNNNIFAKILRGEIPSKKIHEDDTVLAFHDAYPIAETHLLIIPKKPYISYTDFVTKASVEEIGAFFQKVHQIAQTYLGSEVDYRVITNNGKNAGQTVFHFHIHILSGKIYKDLPL